MTVLRPCIVPGCPEYTTGTRCTRHEAEAEARRSSRPFRDSYEARSAKAARLERDHFRCVVCGKRAGDRKNPLEVHHVDGDVRNNVSANLRTLCHTHHMEAEAELRKAVD